MHIHMYMPALINTWTIVWEKKKHYSVLDTYIGRDWFPHSYSGNLKLYVT